MPFLRSNRRAVSFLLTTACAVSFAACARDVEDPIEDTDAQSAIAEGILGGEGTTTKLAAFDANGDIDWNAVQALCDTFRDVASVGETDVYLACGQQGLLHVTPQGVERWNPPNQGSVGAVKAGNAFDVRVLSCYTIYRRGLLGGWVKDGEIKDIHSSGCGTALGTGHGAWFAGGRRIGGVGDLWRLENGTWTSASQKYHFGFEGGYFKFAVLGQNEVLGQVMAPFHSFVAAKFDPWDPGWSFTEMSSTIALWEIPGTGGTTYVSTLDGLFRRARDGARTLEWYPANPDGSHPWISEVWGRSSKDIYAVGRRGLFARSKGDGVWTRTEVPTTDDLEYIWPWNRKMVATDYYGDHFHVVP